MSQIDWEKVEVEVKYLYTLPLYTLPVTHNYQVYIFIVHIIYVIYLYLFSVYGVPAPETTFYTFLENCGRWRYYIPSQPRCHMAIPEIAFDNIFLFIFFINCNYIGILVCITSCCFSER